MRHWGCISLDLDRFLVLDVVLIKLYIRFLYWGLELDGLYLVSLTSNVWFAKERTIRFDHKVTYDLEKSTGISDAYEYS